MTNESEEETMGAKREVKEPTEEEIAAERQQIWRENVDLLVRGRKIADRVRAVDGEGRVTLEVASAFAALLASGVEEVALPPIFDEARKVARELEAEDEVDAALDVVGFLLDDEAFDDHLVESKARARELFGKTDAETVLGVYAEVFATEE
jgi:hypothetical protein